MFLISNSYIFLKAADTKIMDSDHPIRKGRGITRWLRFALKGSIACLTFLVVAIALSFAYLEFFDVGSLVKQTVEDQTGGRFEFSSASFSPFTGLEVKDAQLFPPLIEDPRGFVNGGPVSDKPILRAGRVAYTYRLWRLFIGQFYLKQAGIEDAVVDFETFKDTHSAAGILAYRSEYLEKSEPEDLADQSDASGGTAGLAVVPARFFMPFRILFEDIGLRNASVVFRDHEVGTTLEIKGFSLSLSADWFATSSVFALTQSIGELSLSQGDLEVVLKQNSNISMKDFENVDHKLELLLHSLKSKNIEVSDLPLNIELEAKLSSLFDSVAIGKFSINTLEAIQYLLSGKVSFSAEGLDLDIKQNLKLDLFALNQFVQQVIPELDLFGLIEMENFGIQGHVDLTRISSPDFQLPNISSRIGFNDVRAKHKGLNLKTMPLNGVLALGGGPALVGTGSQIDVIADLDLEGALLDQGDQLAEIRNLKTSLLAKVEIPSATLPVLKFRSHAESVKVSGGSKGFDVPLDIEASAEASHELNDIAAQLRVDLPGIVDALVSASCRAKCNSLKADVNAELGSLENIFALIKPELVRRWALNDVPDKVKGSVALRSVVRGSLPKFGLRYSDEMLDEASLTYRSTLDVRDFRIRMPGRGIDVVGLDQSIGIEGDLKRQKFSFKQTIDSVALAMKKVNPYDIEDFEFETDVEVINENSLRIPSFRDLERLAANTLIKHRTSIEVGYLEASEIPRPLTNIRLATKSELRKFKVLELSRVDIDVPDFGLEGNAEGRLLLANMKDPQSMTFSSNLKIDHALGKVLTSGVKTAGLMDTSLSIVSKDMREFLIGGLAKFENFTIEIPNPNDLNAPLLAVEQMQGSIPLVQRFDLGALKEGNIKDPVAEKLRRKRAEVEGTRLDEEDVELTDSFEAASSSYFEKNNNRLMDMQNQLAIADYDNMRLFFPKRQPLAIKRLQAANLSLSNLEFDIELSERWFTIHQYVVEFLGGKIQGEMRFAFDEAFQPQILKLTTHLTRLDTRKLLKGFPRLKRRTQSWSLLSDPYLDASMHINYDLKNNDIDGGLNITAIGKEQMRMMLFYVDPKEKDPTIATIRNALYIGEVSQVSVPIKNGYVGLDVDVNLLAAPIPTPDLQGFPIAQLIANYRQSAPPEDRQPSSVEESPSDNDEIEEDVGVQPLAH